MSDSRRRTMNYSASANGGGVFAIPLILTASSFRITVEEQDGEGLGISPYSLEFEDVGFEGGGHKIDKTSTYSWTCSGGELGASKATIKSKSSGAIITQFLVSQIPFGPYEEGGVEYPVAYGYTKSDHIYINV